MSSPGFAIGGGIATPPRSRSNSIDDPTPAPRVNAFPNAGNFGLHPDRIMLMNMYDAITKLELWNWLERFTPDPNKGYMFTITPEIQEIAKQTDEMGHSGSSFAFCMRHMEKIAKVGWIEYYRTIIAPSLST